MTQPSQPVHQSASQFGRPASETETETFNPWSVVHLVFDHLCEHGLHPTFGDGGDPAVAARALLVALSIEPSPEGNREVMRAVHSHLEELRTAVFEPAEPTPGRVSE